MDAAVAAAIRQWRAAPDETAAMRLAITLDRAGLLGEVSVHPPQPMQVEVINSNAMELHFDNAVILLSYGVPVAARTRAGGPNYWSSDAAHSMTSRRHVCAFFRAYNEERDDAEDVPADVLRRMLRIDALIPEPGERFA